mgnify:CR=1 FL=1
MSAYREVWGCCGSVSETDGYVPDICPFCEQSKRVQDGMLFSSALELLEELQHIANADPSNWYEEARDQFQQWAQSRARAAIAKAEGKLCGITSKNADIVQTGDTAGHTGGK